MIDAEQSLYLTASNLYEFAVIVNIKCSYREIKEKTDEYYDFIDFGTFCEIIADSKPAEPSK